MTEGWKPIETFPHDGKDYLVSDGKKVLMAYWGKKRQGGKEMIMSCMGPTPYEDEFPLYPDEMVPTHWMPIPKPPDRCREVIVLHHVAVRRI